MRDDKDFRDKRTEWCVRIYNSAQLLHNAQSTLQNNFTPEHHLPRQLTSINLAILLSQHA